MRAGWEASRPRSSWHASDPFWWDGYVARAERRWRDAAVALERANAASHCSPCGLLVAATAWDQAGEADSAISRYEQVWEAPVTDETGEDPMFMPLGLQRLGQLYEQKGNREKALLYYGRFVDLWRAADPELQPLVRDARARIAALTAEPQPRSP
jgi:tetratricopeptide (TPR) repeat protein